MEVQKQAREGAPIHLQQRVVGVHDVDIDLAGERVNRSLDAVSDVVKAVFSESRVRVSIGGCESVLQPP